MKPIVYITFLGICTTLFARRHHREEEYEEETGEEIEHTWDGLWQVDTIFSFGQCCYPFRHIKITTTNDSETGEAILTANFTLPHSRPCQYLGEAGTRIIVNETLNSNLSFIDATNGLSGMLNEQNMTMTWTYGNCYWLLKKGTSIISIGISSFIAFCYLLFSFQFC